MTNRKYDLEERTSKFGEEIIKFARQATKNVVTIPLISQLVRSGTSIGANYCEADEKGIAGNHVLVSDDCRSLALS